MHIISPCHAIIYILSTVIMYIYLCLVTHFSKGLSLGNVSHEISLLAGSLFTTVLNCREVKLSRAVLNMHLKYAFLVCSSVLTHIWNITRQVLYKYLQTYCCLLLGWAQSFKQFSGISKAQGSSWGKPLDQRTCPSSIFSPSCEEMFDPHWSIF